MTGSNMETKCDSCTGTEAGSLLVNTCNFADVKPIMMNLPYPPVQVREANQMYAALLSVDYCGSVSEMSAIVQYINHENRLSRERCAMAKTILGIAIAEMIHMQKLAGLIDLLGGRIDFAAKQSNGKLKLWTPEYLNYAESARGMVIANIEGEKAAIRQYKMHMKMIQDDGVNAVLGRIVKDEEYHILLLQALLEEC